MCGHFVVSATIDELGVRYQVQNYRDWVEGTTLSGPGFFPSRAGNHTFIPVVRMENDHVVLERQRWDLIPAWWKKPLEEKKFGTFNARAENLEKTASYRHCWGKSQRCIIPCSAFFEWPDKKCVPPGEKRREKKIGITGTNFFSLAGIWDNWTLSGIHLFSCAIITTSANSFIQGIPHSRMPVILPPEREKAWLDPQTPRSIAQTMLQPFPSNTMNMQ